MVLKAFMPEVICFTKIMLPNMAWRSKIVSRVEES